MRPRKYPLEPLADLRQRKVLAAAGDLAAATRERAAAERALAEAAKRRDAAAEAVGVARQAELAALARGELRAADLARADAWGVGVARERQALVATVDGARAVEVDARATEGRARGAVAAGRADARVVEQHRARWEDEGRRRLEAAEEEASADAWQPKT